MKALFDTNILIDHVNGVWEAKTLVLEAEDPAISIATWIEVMAGADDASEIGLRAFLSTFRVIDLDDAVAETAAVLRRTRRLKLADAVIWASARASGRILTTRDSKDFPTDDPGIRIPYRLI